MKTSESIEQSEERKAQTHYGKGKNPGSHTPRGNGLPRNVSNLRTPWQPGQSGNPLGRKLDQRHDVAREIARAVFENNREALYNAFADAALKGNAYAFQQLADRAYGKLKERVEFEVSEYREVSEKAIIERIAQLEGQLGIARQIDSFGGTDCPPERAVEASCKTSD